MTTTMKTMMSKIAKQRSLGLACEMSMARRLWMSSCASEMGFTLIGWMSRLISSCPESLHVRLYRIRIRRVGKWMGLMEGRHHEDQIASIK